MMPTVSARSCPRPASSQLWLITKLFAGIWGRLYGRGPPGPCLRVAEGWLGDDEVRQVAAQLLDEVIHVDTGRLHTSRSDTPRCTDRLVPGTALQVQVDAVGTKVLPVGHLAAAQWGGEDGLPGEPSPQPPLWSPARPRGSGPGCRCTWGGLPSHTDWIYQ
jgi:hypothetical protein